MIPSSSCDTGSILVLDASRACVAGGLIQQNEWALSIQTPHASIQGLTDITSRVFQICPPSCIDKIVYCRGPGSTLGLRSCITMLRTWQTIGLFAQARFFHYSSLWMAAHHCLIADHHPEPFAVLAPASQGSFYSVWVNHPTISQTEILDEDRVHAMPGKKYFLQQAKVWPTQSALDAIPLSYHLTYLPRILSAWPDGLEPIDIPQLPVIHRTPFVQWVPQRHRRP